MSRRLPFDITPDTTKFIPISQQTYSIAANKNASAIEQKAMRLIEELWRKGDDLDAEFGIDIPIRFGWSGPERIKLDPLNAQRRFNAIGGSELIKTIAEGKKISVTEATELTQQASQGSIPDSLVEFTAEIYEFFEQQQSIDAELTTSTVLMRRAIPSWNEELTAALPRKIREQLAIIAQEEDESESDAPKFSPPLPHSEPISNSSESTNSQTIGALSSISTTGDLELVAAGK